MDLLIKNMEMPKECYCCRLVQLNKDGFLDCLILGKACSMSSRHPDCPLVEVPAHGDLIDKNKILKRANELVAKDGLDAYKALSIAFGESETVIEAST